MVHTELNFIAVTQTDNKHKTQDTQWKESRFQSFSQCATFLRPHALTVLCHMHFTTPGALPYTRTHTATRKYLCTRLKLIFKFHIHDINELHNKRQTGSKDSFSNVEEDTPPRFSSFLMSMLLHYHLQMLLLLFALNWPAMLAYKEKFHLVFAKGGNATPTDPRAKHPDTPSSDF